MTRNQAPRLALVLTLFLMIAGCATVPMTGRRQLIIIPAGEMQALSFQQYGEVLAESELSTDAEATARIQRVGTRIQGAVERYFRDKNMSGRLNGYDWFIGGATDLTVRGVIEQGIW